MVAGAKPIRVGGDFEFSMILESLASVILVNINLFCEPCFLNKIGYEKERLKKVGGIMSPGIN